MWSISGREAILRFAQNAADTSHVTSDDLTVPLRHRTSYGIAVEAWKVA